MMMPPTLWLTGSTKPMPSRASSAAAREPVFRIGK
ncbi:Uncharacterised protein [Mycobacteroides abscessus subsp. abscessus]|nr:Uncharacterised protein [Mycobacteroides abscessus subsp. abscessus]